MPDSTVTKKVLEDSIKKLTSDLALSVSSLLAPLETAINNCATVVNDIQTEVLQLDDANTLSAVRSTIDEAKGDIIRAMPSIDGLATSESLGTILSGFPGWNSLATTGSVSAISDKLDVLPSLATSADVNAAKEGLSGQIGTVKILVESISSACQGIRSFLDQPVEQIATTLESLVKHVQQYTSDSKGVVAQLKGVQTSFSSMVSEVTRRAEDYAIRYMEAAKATGDLEAMLNLSKEVITVYKKLEANYADIAANGFRLSSVAKNLQGYSKVEKLGEGLNGIVQSFSTLRTMIRQMKLGV